MKISHNISKKNPRPVLIANNIELRKEATRRPHRSIDRTTIRGWEPPISCNMEMERVEEFPTR